MPMKVEVHQFVPVPLADQVMGSSSQVWRQHHVDLTEAGVNIVVSESGRGKSSLLNSLYGLRKDYHGSIFLNGRDIKDFEVADWERIRREEVSMVFQDFKLFPKLTLMENIEIKNELSGHKTPSQIEDLIHSLGLWEYRRQSAATLSIGQQQRLAIVRALCQPFGLIVLDEPFSHLDPENTRRAFNLIKEEAGNQKARVLISALHREDVPQYDKCYKL